MMNQKRSVQRARWRYLGVIPMLMIGLIFISFREKDNDDRPLPVFPGCQAKSEAEQQECSTIKLMEYVQSYLVYPESMKEGNVSGTVLAKFTVDETGLVLDASISRSLHPDADQNVLDLINKMNERVGAWQPAVKEGIKVGAEMVLPVKFALTAENKPEAKVDQLAEFPGCSEITNEEERQKCAQSKLWAFIGEHLKYPEQDRQRGVEGTGIARFVITANGQMRSIEVVRSPSEGIRQEIERVMELMADTAGEWTPAKKEGKNVDSELVLPIKFKLDPADTPAPVATEDPNSKTVAIQLRPNPANDEVIIDLPAGAQSLIFLDENGSVVLSRNVESHGPGEMTIGVSKLQPGWYGVQVQGKGYKGTGKFSIVR